MKALWLAGILLLAATAAPWPWGADQIDAQAANSERRGSADEAGELRTRLDAWFAELHARGLFDGAVVVARGAEIVWERGYGLANIERQAPFTPDTNADGGSLAKTLTAALVLMLQEERLVALDQPVRRWVPELPYEEMTLRHLLSHSSGLPVLDYDYFDKRLPAGDPRTTDSLVRAIGSEKPALLFAPGTRFEYSSFGFDVAALAAARAAGKPYFELLTQKIFEPLGIRSAFVRPSRLHDFPGVRTTAYRVLNGRRVPHDVFDFEGFHGGSNVYLSARDLHRWNASFLDRSPLSAAALGQAMQFARIGSGTSGLTLGSWYRSADGSTAWYSGHLQGFHSEAFRDSRSRTSVVYMSNNTLEPWVQKGIIRAVRAAIAGRQPPALTAPSTVPITAENVSALPGRWAVDGLEPLAIERVDGRLLLQTRGVSYRMVQVNPQTFYVPGLDFMVGFARDAAGALTRLHIASNVDDRWGRRTP